MLWAFQYWRNRPAVAGIPCFFRYQVSIFSAHCQQNTGVFNAILTVLHCPAQTIMEEIQYASANRPHKNFAHRQHISLHLGATRGRQDHFRSSCRF